MTLNQDLSRLSKINKNNKIQNIFMLDVIKLVYIVDFYEVISGGRAIINSNKQNRTAAFPMYEDVMDES